VPGVKIAGSTPYQLPLLATSTFSCACTWSGHDQFVEDSTNSGHSHFPQWSHQVAVALSQPSLRRSNHVLVVGFDKLRSAANSKRWLPWTPLRICRGISGKERRRHGRYISYKLEVCCNSKMCVCYDHHGDVIGTHHHGLAQADISLKNSLFRFARVICKELALSFGWVWTLWVWAVILI
jgi:hypothetical protein